MRKGGYKIIDLKDVNFISGVGQTIKGIHNSIESSYRKALLLSGIVLDGVEHNDTFITYEANDTTFIISNVYKHTITITAEDLVTCTAISE